MSSTAAAAAQAMHKQSRVLACVLCQHRKIKCDRNTPCSNCVKANVTCTPSTPAPARKRRRPNQDLQERLARCEDLLKQYAGAPKPGSAPNKATSAAAAFAASTASTSTDSVSRDEPPLTPSTSESQTDMPDASSSNTTPASTEQPFSSWKPTGKMIKQDGNVRFMDSFLWANVYDELRAIKVIVDTDEPEDCSNIGSEDQTPENNAELFFPGDASTGSVENLQPDPIHAFRLWQLFLDRVNPLLKIVHVPSLQPYILDGATNIAGVPQQYQALIFAIYAMATVSLSEIEAMQMLGMSRDAALSKFTVGIKISLVRFNFLKNYDMVILQTLVLYLVALQGRYDRHAAWILSGTVVRIAQKMGYHRDGELLNLPPFETEMRRRIWWQIIMQDAKYAMASGLSHSLLPVNWDTKAPLNVNDADLFPESTEPIQPREGPTEMAFCLILFEIVKFLINTASSQSGFEAAILGQEPDGTQRDATSQSKESLAQYFEMVEQLETSMKTVEERHIDAAAGNVHGAALTIRPMMSRKLKELLIPMREQPEWGTEVFGPKDKLFKIVLINIEQNTYGYDLMADRGFLWFVKMHFQLDAFGVMTMRLVQRPTGTLADRAWTVMERVYLYHPELFDLSQKPHLAQAQLTWRAWRAREQAFAASHMPIEAPAYVVRLHECMVSLDATRSNSLASSNTPPPATQHPQQVTELDQFLGGYLDVSGLNWDMWGDVPGSNTNQLSQALLSSFDISTMGGM